MILDDTLLDPAIPTSSLTWSSEKSNVSRSAAVIILATALRRPSLEHLSSKLAIID